MRRCRYLHSEMESACVRTHETDAPVPYVETAAAMSAPIGGVKKLLTTSAPDLSLSKFGIFCRWFVSDKGKAAEKRRVPRRP